MKSVPASTLAERTRTHLHTLLKEGRWPEGLPAERTLAADLGVSRPVLRTALGTLEQQGFIKRDGKGKRHASRKIRAKQNTRSVLVVHPSPPSSMPASTSSMLNITTDLLNAQQIKLHHTTCLELKLNDVSKALQNLHNQYPEEIWLLRSPSTAALRWCASHHPRCVILGTQPTPASFPGVDLEINTIFQHTLQLCEQRKCENIVFLVPAGTTPAQRKLERFLQQQKNPKLSTSIQGLPNRDTQSAINQLLHLLAAKPRPDAFICTNFQHWLLIYSTLTEAGLSPHKDFFLLCHYPDPLMQWVSHGVPHYSFDWSQAAHFLTKHILLSIQTPSEPEILSLQPSFVPA